jgi:ribosomal protein RSM22 (predicted rRNA methylase)
MQLPAQLRTAIVSKAESVNGRELAKAAEQISKRYRSEDFKSPIMRTDAERAAYALTRMPATYAASRHVFEQIRGAVPETQIESVLDLGAGAGSASWAAVEVFPSIQRISMVERDAAFAAMAREFAAKAGSEALRNATHLCADMRTNPPSAADLVILSYALGELTREDAARVIAQALQAAKKLLVVVEPGTMRGFGTILAVRELLLGAHQQLVAPCPHHNVCPMAAAGDWCHVAQRIERTAEHRRLKGADLGYEDEKFSYVAAAKFEFRRPSSRIVRHPLIRPGHIQLTLCTPDGLKLETIGKSQKEKFRAARAAYWGAPWMHP